MSRVGKKPIPIPDKTKITYEGRLLTVKGDKGTLSRSIPPAIDLQVEDGCRGQDQPCIAGTCAQPGKQHDYRGQ